MVLQKVLTVWLTDIEIYEHFKRIFETDRTSVNAKEYDFDAGKLTVTLWTKESERGTGKEREREIFLLLFKTVYYLYWYIGEFLKSTQKMSKFC